MSGEAADIRFLSEEIEQFKLIIKLISTAELWTAGLKAANDNELAQKNANMV